MGKITTSIVILCPILLVACATNSIGTQPSDNPPKLVNVASLQGVEWDRAGAFGPVPAKLQLAGDALCSKDTGVLKSTAIGYHPRALDKAGQPIDGGGYLCKTLS